MDIKLLAILLLFGGKKIPNLVRGSGKGMSEFKHPKKSLKEQIKVGMKSKNNEKRNSE
jgi:sec-independent protein translocase protein TatA